LPADLYLCAQHLGRKCDDIGAAGCYNATPANSPTAATYSPYLGAWTGGSCGADRSLGSSGSAPAYGNVQNDGLVSGS
jgi:hypothetical protein